MGDSSESRASSKTRVSRRTVLGGGLAVATGVGVAGYAATRHLGTDTGAATDREAASEGVSGTPDQEFQLTATVGEIEVAAGETVETWFYDEYPGPELRVEEGERVRITVKNDLPDETSAHWHGMVLDDANEMDGVPGVTQDPIEPGDEFVYEFEASPSGTHWYHSHVGLQLDRGLLGPLVVEETDPHVEYDREHVIVFDEYLTTEPEVTTERRGMMRFPGAPPYDGTLVNGKLPSEPETLTVEDGERVRLRFLNAGSATTYRVTIAGHSIEITHADGPAVEPVEVDSFEIGMGERFDGVIDATDPGTWEIHAHPLNDDTPAGRALLWYEESDDEEPQDDQPGTRELDYSDLRAATTLDQHDGSPDRTLELHLSPGGMMGGDQDEWTINGEAYPDAEPLRIEEGEHVQVHVTNHSPMRHPMHLHGHHFEMEGALHDTVTVPGHMGQRTFNFVADNPGNWMFHCHNTYHMETGMARVFEYD